jgi:hypothetical protein
MCELPVVIYTPTSPLRNPKGLAREMLRDLAGTRELAWRLFIRDVIDNAQADPTGLSGKADRLGE